MGRKFRLKPARAGLGSCKCVCVYVNVTSYDEQGTGFCKLLMLIWTGMLLLGQMVRHRCPGNVRERKKATDT